MFAWSRFQILTKVKFKKKKIFRAKLLANVVLIKYFYKTKPTCVVN